MDQDQKVMQQQDEYGHQERGKSLEFQQQQNHYLD